MTYLAKCAGQCAQAVPQQLTWVKFQEASRIEPGPIPGLWGSDLLTKAGSTITMTLPQGLESGEYVSAHLCPFVPIRAWLVHPGRILIQGSARRS
jgi:hypothetical protein